jgi:GT2 family glycosyltransferase
VRNCLQHLAKQSRLPDEIIVVDSSPDDLTRQVVTDEFPLVKYLRNPLGPGTTAAARHLGFREATGDIIAFIDDDAYAHEEWLEHLVAPYRDPLVGGVGGRALNGVAGEEQTGVEEIGLMLPDGVLTGYFAADPGRIIEVDHFLGANMSYRRAVIEELGGVRDGYPGTCLREETDLALRVKKAGWKLVFTPWACVDHVAGPYRKGRRFDFRYQYYAQRNHIVLLTRIYGLRSSIFRRYLALALRDMASETGRSARAVTRIDVHDPRSSARPVVGGVARAGTSLVGLASGLVAGQRELARDGRT